MKQRILKISNIIGITVVSILFLVAVTIGVVFQFVLTPDKITPKVVQAINQNLNAELSIDAIELTFFKTFPNFKLELKNGIILNTEGSFQDSISSPNDTLIEFDYGVVSINPLAFLADNIKINKFSFENPKIYAYVSPEGNPNWTILKERDPVEKDSLLESDKEQKDFNASINIEEISIINGNLIFDDRYSENYMTMQGFDMNLAAKYSKSEVMLKLLSQSDNVIIRKKGDTYTEELTVVLNTGFHVNRKTKVIDLKNAQVGINDIVFDTEGKLYPNVAKKEVDVDLKLNLEVPRLSTLIDLIPETIFDKTNEYQAKGDVNISAAIKGIYKKGETPEIKSNIKISDGEISYQNKPNKIELIEADIDLYISPQIRTGSQFEIKNFTIKGVGTEISVKATGVDLFENSKIDMTAEGMIDFEALENSFPFKKSLNLEGSGNIQLSTKFNVNDVKNQDYGKIQALGSLDMNKLVYQNDADSLKLNMESANIHIEQDQNSTLLTNKSSKVIGGKILIKNLEFKDGKKSSGNLDLLDIKFATTPLKDSTRIAVMKSSILIQNGNLKLGDTLEAKLKLINAKATLQPDRNNVKIPSIYSKFNVDSTGIYSKGRFFAITKGNYELSSTKVGKNWPITGDIFFDQ
ncbi:MAG: hypothetical protein GY908_11675, partial [Flavobacteriales bacterium]|nr:hypothetical protein [Flavobacteriales bacterium]